MRRISLILALIAASAAGFAATAASSEDTRVYYVELDNAFGLVNGSEVLVAGVQAGTITDFFINSDKRAVARLELSGPVAVLGEDTICSTEPQSLIAEYFMDCAPKGDPIEEGTGTDEERSENPDIPVEQTRQTVQQDLVLSAMRAPFRDRLTLLINEFGTALAGNAENLNAAIRRGSPALIETREVFNLLAGQNTLIRDLNEDSDRIIGELAKRRADVVAFIEEAENAASTSAERREDLSQNFALLDDFLAELEPTMTELNAFAVQGTPLASDLRRAAPGLNTLSRLLPDFNPAATDSVVSLGEASVVGERALEKGRDEIAQLADAAKNSFSPADDLAKFLRDIDDPNRAIETDRRANRDTGRKGETGYTGMEGLLNYVYYQPGAINQYDQIGHLLHFSIFEIGSGPCRAYNAGEYDPDGPEGSEEPQPGVPNLDGSAATTDIEQANRCVAWLGDNQPGLNSGPKLPGYSPKVCPNNDEADLGNTPFQPAVICPKTTGGAAAQFRASSSAASGNAPAADPADSTTPAPGEEPAPGTGDAVDPGAVGDALPDVPAPPTAPGAESGSGLPGLDSIGDALPRSAAPRTDEGASSANQDLLGYLFGN